jgi:hypothetical protein
MKQMIQCKCGKYTTKAVCDECKHKALVERMEKRGRGA